MNFYRRSLWVLRVIGWTLFVALCAFMFAWGVIAWIYDLQD